MNQNIINFKDINAGYEPFVEALETMGFNWEVASKNDLHAIASIAISENPITQPAFDIPANGTCENGQPANKFAYLAGIFTGIQAVLLDVEGQLNSMVAKNPINMIVPMLSVTNNSINFLIIKE